ncbi:hypothetical protein KDL01_03205 [Actinospica durhamensis]|uniref:Uncharacterized protein n=1 Tax=Actinospica durhamensis TaxID=1508375 RepID=A0A941ER38_9ACTN|nr:hypothetical protein [Actinospica durhamensis]MBR7832249.1 hypothetical protein [Actinospica durhamensis]
MPPSGSNRKSLREGYRATGRGFALTVPVLIAALVLIAAVTAVGIWLWTSSSGVRGDASVTRQHNSGQNQVAQNTKLLGDQATVLSDQQKIQVLAANVTTQQDKIDLQGLELNCLTDVAAYNADVRNILASGLLPSGLPSAYPTTVCEVSKS